MNVPQRRKPVVEPTPNGSTVGAFLGRRRAGLGALAMVLAAAVGIGWLWWRYGDAVGWAGDNLLEPARIEVRGVAPWVRADIKSEAIKAASLDRGLPLTDPELANRLARAFDTHPWVKRVIEVRLAHPPAAVVEIVCREPAAVVAVKGGLLAVDTEAFVLPSTDFSPETAAEYPRLTGIESSPQGPEGSRWGDVVVEEGAAVASVIGPDWQALGLVECKPVVEAGVRRWDLIGPEGKTIRFGSAPGHEREGEPSAALKAAALRKLVGQPLPDAGVDLTTYGGSE
ncbi:MAG: hypothetical protein WCR51_08405 [Planctomycetia bacterium]